jgi:hypothetical protein
MLINVEITCNNRMLVVIKATNKCIQASKTIKTLSLSKIIKQKTKENSRLRQELAC